MASLNNLYLKLETLETLVKRIKSKGENGISIDISINDEANQYNQNVSAYVTQSKDDRDNKKPRYYVGNGRTFWTDGTITAFKNESNDSGKKDMKKELEPQTDDLPF